MHAVTGALLRTGDDEKPSSLAELRFSGSRVMLQFDPRVSGLCIGCQTHAELPIKVLLVPFV
jgi:hypothetical protein